MPRMFKPADARQDAEFTAAFCQRCERSLVGICPILKAGRRHDTTDVEFPAEWIYDDDNRPACTALELRAGIAVASTEPAAQPMASAAAAPVAAAAEPKSEREVTSISVTTIGKGLAAALKPRPGHRSWTVPYASVSELFADDKVFEAMREGFKVPEPTQARVHRNHEGVTITATSRRDRSSVSSRVSLKFAGVRA